MRENKKLTYYFGLAAITGATAMLGGALFVDAMAAGHTLQAIFYGAGISLCVGLAAVNVGDLIKAGRTKGSSPLLESRAPR